MDVVGFGALNVDEVRKISPDLATELGISSGGEREGRANRYSAREILERLEDEELIGVSGGGSAANTIVALSRMGFKTGYIGKVGTDVEGNFLLRTLKGVDTSQICISEGPSGRVISCQIGENKDRSLVVFPGVNDEIDIDYSALDYTNSAKALHLTSFIGNRSFEAQIELSRGIDINVVVSLDGGQLYAERGLRALKPLLKETEIFFPSEEEVRILTGEDYRDGSRKLLEYGPYIIVVTRGDKGCYILEKDSKKDTGFELPAYPLGRKKIKDTTGAGDVFAAAFLARLLKNGNLLSCADFANRMAAKSITGIGRKNYPTRKDFESQ